MKLFKRKYTPNSNQQEVKNLLANRLEKLRQLIEDGSPEAYDDTSLYEAFEPLALYCFKNLEIPESHRSYIAKNLMGRKNVGESFTKHDAIFFLQSKQLLKDDNYFLEFPLRAIEVMINYNEHKLTYEQMFYILDYIFDFYKLK
ncbi:hypothetical protein [Aquimarina mytili]|uniref:Uncharacterized protein n=1 Tax=Aquimarina mytili TaxID=874423 RepID=A0A936ZUX9_9FLAO|nr:hypothetical protein [Aquimarina mytili]MBL0686054.1 hypothetical protein [Aquimarina mytili]